MITAMIVNAYHCTCDICGAETTVAADNLSDARAELKAEGWIPAKFRRCYCSQECHARKAMNE